LEQERTIISDLLAVAAIPGAMNRQIDGFIHPKNAKWDDPPAISFSSDIAQIKRKGYSLGSSSKRKDPFWSHDTQLSLAQRPESRPRSRQRLA